MRIPLTFVCFAYFPSKMYRLARTKQTFMIEDKHPHQKYVTYGALYFLQDAEFYINILDSYFICSKSRLKRNHKNDLHHRIPTTVTQIQFSSIDEFERLKFVESDLIDCQTYIGNLLNYRINSRINKTTSYRVTNGIDKQFIKLLKEVL